MMAVWKGLGGGCFLRFVELERKNGKQFPTRRTHLDASLPALLVVDGRSAGVVEEGRQLPGEVNAV